MQSLDAALVALPRIPIISSLVVASAYDHSPQITQSSYGAALRGWRSVMAVTNGWLGKYVIAKNLSPKMGQIRVSSPKVT
jgi:hypothetical protein